MPGSSAAGGDARRYCGRGGWPAVLPPVAIRGGPLCRGFDWGGTAPPPSSRKTSCAGAPDAGSRPPSPALAGGARFALAICAATRQGTKRATPALLLENPTIRGEGGTARRRRVTRDAHAGFQRPPVKPLGGSG